MDFTTKTVIVTGSALGIGLAIATKFLEKGSKVLLTDINVTALDAAFDKLEEKYGENVKRTQFSCDVSNFDNIQEAFDVCGRELGPPNVLINNAGISCEDDFRKTLRVLLEAQVKGTEIAIEFMGKHNGGKGGNVINISSIAGIKPVIPYYPYYSSAKAGVVSYTRNIGHQLNFDHTGVKVQCLCPGGVSTAMLQNSIDATYSPHLSDHAAKVYGQPAMKPEEMASCLLTLLQEGKPGAVMCAIYGKDPWYEE